MIPLAECPLGRRRDRGVGPACRVKRLASVVRLKVESMGTNQRITCFGHPAIQDGIIPFACPQGTLHQAQDKSAYGRLHIDVCEAKTGACLRTTPREFGYICCNPYASSFSFTCRTTDSIPPP